MATQINTDAIPQPVRSGIVPPAWTKPLLLWLAILVGMAIIFWPTLTSLVIIWANNVSYEYCFLIVPIIAYLVYERRAELAKLSPSPSLWGAVLFAGAALLWLLGEAGDINLVRHAAFIFMLQASVLAAFGIQILRALLFPTVFAAFMIPAGEQFIAPLQEVTAWFCVKLLQLFQVPFTTDGLFIHAPNGTFEVAEACSGIRYLTTMVALGSVYANLCFKSTLRRAIVMFMAVVFPVVANGIRAWSIIYLGYISDNKVAQGVDHILYGWVFFSLVMVIFIAACWKFADRPLTMPAIDLSKFRINLPAAPLRAIVTTAVAVFALLLGTFGYANVMRSRTATLAAPSLNMFSVPGWSASDHADVIEYQPYYSNASAQKKQLVSDGEGRFIQIYMAVYDRQAEGKEMVSYGNGPFLNAVDEHQSWVWTGNEAAPALKNIPPPYAITIYKDRAVRDVWQWFYVNGKVVSSPSAAKLEAAKARLLGGRTDAATLILSSERVVSTASHASHLQVFTQQMGSVEASFKNWITSASAGGA
jgi:exosortase A